MYSSLTPSSGQAVTLHPDERQEACEEIRFLIKNTMHLTSITSKRGRGHSDLFEPSCYLCKARTTVYKHDVCISSISTLF